MKRLILLIGALALSPFALSQAQPAAVPRYDHVVVVIEENHAYKSIIGSTKASYINSLANQGALFANAFAEAHPSQPNYFALFTGSTWGIKDDDTHNFAGPSFGGQLVAAGKTFIGYFERGSPRKHNPWESFADSKTLGRNLSAFPTDFTKLPTVSYVLPNAEDDMHSGTVQRADRWLKTHLDAYATWAKTHNSLLIVTWDEDDKTQNNQIADIFVGANVTPGKYPERIDHYSILRTLEEMYGLDPLGNARTATPITSIWASR